MRIIIILILPTSELCNDQKTDFKSILKKLSVAHPGIEHRSENATRLRKELIKGLMASPAFLSTEGPTGGRAEPVWDLDHRLSVGSKVGIKIFLSHL
jgi:hypothetical protein